MPSYLYVNILLYSDDPFTLEISLYIECNKSNYLLLDSSGKGIWKICKGYRFKSLGDKNFLFIKKNLSN